MNAQQFIKEHGLEKAREVVLIQCEYGSRLYVDELKTLLRSVDVVNRIGSYERVVELHNRYKDSPIAHKHWIGVSVDRMKQAIADYESIYGEGNG